MSNSYTLHYTDGSNSRYGISESAALAEIAAKYGVEVTNLVTHDDDGARPRILIWTDDESAEDDDGSNAVAELIRE